MLCLLPKRVQPLILLLMFSFGLTAQAKPERTYDQTGTITAIPWRGRAFQITAGDRIYLMSCAARPHLFQMELPRCKNSENKPYAVGDSIHFRVDRGLAYLPLAKGKEERFEIEDADLRMVPPLPTANANDQSAGQEHAIVVSIRAQNEGTYSSTTAAASSSFGAPSTSIGPVTAIPVTGGSPQVIIPTGSSSGGVVTGVPVTGGPPITGISTAPTPASASSSASANLFPATSRWPTVTRMVRIESSDKIYDLVCPWNSCVLAGKAMELGDMVSFRKDAGWVYFGSDQYQILKVMDLATPKPEASSTPTK
jgi:hypothetical protein